MAPANLFFEQPVLNSPYVYPARHWELDGQGQPTQKIIHKRRKAEFLTPIPKPKKNKGEAVDLDLFASHEHTRGGQQYDPTPIINLLRETVDAWRELPSPNDWKVTPETARLLQHWRHYKFSGIRPFFCQVEQDLCL
jgi:type III restriction enzyme